jgi:hypothetical protein
MYASHRQIVYEPIEVSCQSLHFFRVHGHHGDYPCHPSCNPAETNMSSPELDIEKKDSGKGNENNRIMLTFRVEPRSMN